MGSKFQICEITDLNVWDGFVEKTPQYTIFSSSEYLSSFGGKFKLFFVKKGIITRAAFCVLLSNDSTKIMLDDLVIYGGIFFDLLSDQKEVKAKTERFEISEVIIEFLSNHYSEINISLSPFFEDLRPFLWHNYHSDTSNKFILNLRYTSYVDISSLSQFDNEEDTDIFKKLEILRQRNIRKARKEQAYTIECEEIDFLLECYEDLMNMQGEIVQKTKISNMKNIMHSMLNNKKAAMFVSKNIENKIIYITFFIFDKNRAYYLFGAGNSETKEPFKGTICFWDAFIILAQKYNIKIVDMEGINSPKRGWFKLSFSGNIVPYYEVKLG